MPERIKEKMTVTLIFFNGEEGEEEYYECVEGDTVMDVLAESDRYLDNDGRAQYTLDGVDEDAEVSDGLEVKLYLIDNRDYSEAIRVTIGSFSEDGEKVVYLDGDRTVRAALQNAGLSLDQEVFRRNQATAETARLNLTTILRNGDSIVTTTRIKGN